eukprot:CAMPEP_0174296484 /NCGR_PEP_ID=MMETSP0809-20121228/48031_1 /TAXON_ID=73025 ORGANISM="Eutreptiella gymnastica-like, Strain CCMP1594" /NCGR_SAMPLE_ID=MMETSP0809 /ASSEMBLY_ACC=CAM_ASM_000658 /LENGTH=55 /DNA_ID=CAMNT_0015399519 /DNA_START=308 /DNA_END=475 /DNA_ORIENTATION=+
MAHAIGVEHATVILCGDNLTFGRIITKGRGLGCGGDPPPSDVPIQAQPCTTLTSF